MPPSLRTLPNPKSSCSPRLLTSLLSLPPSCQILRGEVEPPPELATMTDKLALCCAPQMAGVRGAAVAPVPVTTAAGTPAAAATTYTTTTTTTVPAEGAVLGATEGPAVITPMR